MKCLETENLIRYAYHLTDEPAAAEVRAHLGDCPRCRGIVEQYGRLNALLDEWKTAEPTPGFDARVRQAVEAQQATRATWGFAGLGWARGVAVAALGVLIIAGTIWFTQRYHRGSDLSAIASPQSRQPGGPQTAAPATKLISSAVPSPSGVRPAQAASERGSAVALANEDQEALALEDYDLAANFDLLSELPKGESRVGN